MNTTHYLHRIAYEGPLIPNEDTLRALHRAYLLSVPFENLSIHTGEQIQLNYAWLYDKIVTRKRGGFCYELNGLFGALLTSLGFRVEMLSARVATGEGFGPEFDHMVLLVHLDEPWLADVGFGASFLEPLRLNQRASQADPAGNFRIIEQRDGFEMQEWVSDHFESQHFFTLTAHTLPAFEAMCHYHQTSPNSHFTQKLVCSKAIPTGRLTLSGKRLIRTQQGAREEQVVEGADEINHLLDVHFGIKLA